MAIIRDGSMTVSGKIIATESYVDRKIAEALGTIPDVGEKPEVGDIITTDTLYETAYSTENVRQTPITGQIETINLIWRNEIRLISTTSGHYLGFTRLSDLTGVDSPGNLEINGLFDTRTVKKWQEAMGLSIVDGVMSGQAKGGFLYRSGLAPAATFTSPGTGSNLIEAWQIHIGVSADRLYGAGTNTATANYLGVADDLRTVIKEIQRRLNNGTLV